LTIKRRKSLPYGESCASSDLAFLLIIYFLVIAGFNVNQGFLMNLPERDSTRLIPREDLMRFEINIDGAIFHEGREINISVAEREIRAAIAGNPNLAVVLSVDPAASWQQVVSFVELAQKLQVESFSFNIKGQT
jgi:biopolymer transport protein ExbD